jgi:hypothetical protein
MLKSFNEFINESTITAGSADASTMVNILKKYVGKREEGNNSGEMVKGFLRHR